MKECQHIHKKGRKVDGKRDEEKMVIEKEEAPNKTTFTTNRVLASPATAILHCYTTLNHTPPWHPLILFVRRGTKKNRDKWKKKL